MIKKKNWTKTTWGGKDLSWLTGYSSSWSGAKENLESRTEAEVVEERCLLTCSTCFLIYPPNHLPKEVAQSPQQSLIKKIPPNLPPGQSVTANFSADVSSSLACVKLTEKANQHTATHNHFKGSLWTWYSFPYNSTVNLWNTNSITETEDHTGNF